MLMLNLESRGNKHVSGPELSPKKVAAARQQISEKLTAAVRQGRMTRRYCHGGKDNHSRFFFGANVQFAEVVDAILFSAVAITGKD